MRTLCVGEALVDLICERPVASLAEADAFVPHFGGAVANVAVTAARRGARVALAGGAGADGWGAWLRERLAGEGVDLEFFTLVEGAPTPVAFVTVDAHAQPTFAIYGDGIRTTVTAIGERLVGAVDACDALFCASNTLVAADERALTLAARDRALTLGRPVVVDPNLRLHRWPDTASAVAAVAQVVDGAFLVKCNAQEAALLTGEEDPPEAAAALVRAGARHVVVTLGAQGALLRGGGLDRDAAGVPAAPVDATGAGDAVTGVLLAALGRSGYDPAALADALPDAVEAGARATERWGAVSA
jgi:fructokinase